MKRHNRTLRRLVALGLTGALPAANLLVFQRPISMRLLEQIAHRNDGRNIIVDAGPSCCSAGEQDHFKRQLPCTDHPAFLGDAARYFDKSITIGKDGMLFSLPAGSTTIQRSQLK